MTAPTTHLVASDAPILSVKPVSVPTSGRYADLVVRVSAPVAGDNLPVILFSHGYGESMDGYGPLVDWWTSRGYVVVQPTYLDSRSVGMPDDHPLRGEIWRQRALDATRVLDALDHVLGHIVGLPERTDTTRIAAVGHSFGGQTTALLLGAGVIDPETGDEFRCADDRIAAGVLIATAGRGSDLSPMAREHFPYVNAVFGEMSRPMLVIAGDKDDSPLTTRGPDWMTDPYTDGPDTKHLLTVVGGEHSLGGIAGYDVSETTDENPGRVRFVRETVTAFLDDALKEDSAGWDRARADLGGAGGRLGTLESKY
ncbi:chlorophyllase [Gordonia sp. OPL2]|uniref:alpha/beta hydrolase family protein n=1 Tax=Gordonia sp. OPL2 TaxID=2486274 RepID=UPI0016563102|nr:chlorophyllase [Gordonia sp. OPL2]ROZ85979.1 chlorophyllase [Gordonia sp. OPL2]